MAVSRAERRAARHDRVVAWFPEEQASVVLDLLELMEIAWHDCYGEASPPEDVVDDVLVCGGGDLGRLIGAARLALADWRDLRVGADGLRAKTKGSRYEHGG